MKNLHQMNPIIIHRDLKSLNIFVTKDHGKWKLKVADFGLSRSPDAGMMTTQLGTIVHYSLNIALDGSRTPRIQTIFQESWRILFWNSFVGNIGQKDTLLPFKITNGYIEACGDWQAETFTGEHQQGMPSWVDRVDEVVLAWWGWGKARFRWDLWKTENFT